VTLPGLIQRGDILARIAKSLGVKDRGPSPTLDNRVQPVFLVGDARDEPAGGLERPFFGYEVFTGAAGQFAAIQCLNPATSGVDLIVDYVLVSGSAATLVDFRLNTAVLANPTTKATQYRDTTPGQPLAQIRAESLAVGVLGAAQVRLPTQQQAIVPLDIRFLPGIALTFVSQVAANNLQVSFFGRELLKPYRTT
jgi:hypothetical protein